LHSLWCSIWPKKTLDFPHNLENKGLGFFLTS
jgi:hypothetical protein